MEQVSNITEGIRSRMGKSLHNKKNHPLEIIKKKIYDYFGDSYKTFDNLDPIVKIEENFDKLLIPKEHPARSKSDTYYVDSSSVLRTHTSAHQNELMIDGNTQFLVTGDVYRKDEIDSSHYPVFHQMEGVCIVENGQDAKEELVKTLDGLVGHLFPGCEYRINDDYFPFTEPSIEIEVMFQGEWLEILGGGVIQRKILDNCGLKEKSGWAFGLGLERLAMILFRIPDIRYFWSEDPRFIKQFESGEIVEFKEYSKYPPVFKDVAFWVNGDYNYNNFCEIVRETAGDIVEDIEEIDKFTHPKTMRTSHCYRITYRSNDRSLTNMEVDSIQNQVRNLCETNLHVELR